MLTRLLSIRPDPPPLDMPQKYPIDGSRDALWMATAVDAPTTGSLRGDIDTDVAIIGGGLTGLNAALRLMQHNLKVCVVEANGLGYGASGRSGGQVNLGLNLGPAALLEKFGRTQGERLIQMIISTPDQVFQWIKDNQLKCDPVQRGWVQGASNQNQYKSQRQMAAEYGNHGCELPVLDADALRKRSGAQGYIGGLFVPGAGSLHPLSYTRELARAAMAKGAQVFTDSTVTGLSQSDNRQWQISTSGGNINSRQVLICTNGYTDSLINGLQQTVVPVRSLLVATEPLDADTRQQVLLNQVTFVDKRRLILYFRYDRDGRLCVGDHGPMRDQFRLEDFNAVKKRAVAVFPQLAGKRWDYHWGGRVAMTKNTLPFLYHIAPGLTAGMGYNGRGVGMGTMMGKALAQSIVSPEACDFPQSQPKRFLMHKFHSAGVSMTVKWLALRDHLDSL
ncbi:MAG: FAD-dependent oxidoreductase [Pseudomonadota bacterium]